MTGADPPGGEDAPVAPAPQAVTAGDRRLLAVGLLLTAGSAVAHEVAGRNLVTFAVTTATLAAVAAIVSRSVDRLGDRLGAGTTGVVQSALGNLPELFVSIFALRAGLVTVVQAAVVGSSLGNVLLVLGAALFAGGWRHGTQHFHAGAARNAVLLLSLAGAIVVVPTLSAHLAVPAAHHEGTLSDVAAVVLLVLFCLSVPWSLRSHELDVRSPRPPSPTWPLRLSIVALAASSVAAAFVSDWFIAALQPALGSLHISQAFAGLVIVAIAGNAVENVVGVSLAVQNRMDYALSVILQSPVQILLFLLPLLVLISQPIGGPHFTLVFPPLDVVALVLGNLVAVIVVFDGESNWLEGSILIGLYVTIAASFWWG